MVDRVIDDSVGIKTDEDSPMLEHIDIIDLHVLFIESRYYVYNKYLLK
jgi:hypothetical protein